MASAATLRLLLERALERERSGILRRGSGVRRSHVVRQIGERLFRRRWLTTHEQRLGLDTPLGSADLREAIRVVRAIGPLLLEATAACAEVVDLVADALHAQGLTTTPAELSSPVASAVGSYAVGRGARPGAKDVRMLASKVVDRILAAQARRQWATGGHTLTPTEAIARYDTMDDHCWERLGHASNEIFPPDGVLLGPNRRTPLVAGGGRPNWQVGTGRSIYERYRLRWISDTKIDCKHLKRVPVASAADPFAQEVVRACHPYGLRGRSYQEIVEALYVGGLAPMTVGEAPEVGTRSAPHVPNAASCRPATSSPRPSPDCSTSGGGSVSVARWCARIPTPRSFPCNRSSGRLSARHG